MIPIAIMVLMGIYLGACVGICVVGWYMDEDDKQG